MKVKKREVTMKLNKMVDVEVDWISVVKRGANRIPIRAIKSEDVENTEENEMSLWERLFQKDEEVKSDKPEVIAIIVPENLKDELSPQIAEQGYVIDKAEAKDGVVCFKQPNWTEDVTLIKVNDDVFVAISNVSKAFEPFTNSTSFSENFKKGSFFPSVRMASSALEDTLINIMFSAEGSNVPKEEVETSLDEFKSFIMTALKNIPKEAFKLETVLAKSVHTPNDKPKGKKADEEEVDMDDKKLKALQDFLTTEQETVLEKMTEKTEEIKASIQEVSKSIGGRMDTIENRLKNLEEVSEGYDAKIKEVTELAKSTDTAVSGMAPGGSTDADGSAGSGEGGKEQTEKSDDDLWGTTMGALDDFRSSVVQ